MPPTPQISSELVAPLVEEAERKQRKAALEAKVRVALGASMGEYWIDR